LDGTASPGNSAMFITLQPKQFTSTFSAADIRPNSSRKTMVQEGNSLLNAKQQEINENLTVLRVQEATPKEELKKINQQAKTYNSLASLPSRLCSICHETGHTKTCRNAPCCDIDSCKIKDKHPKHKTNFKLHLLNSVRILKSNH